MKNPANPYVADAMPEYIRAMDSETLWAHMVAQMGLSLYLRSLAKIGPMSVEALEELATTTGYYASLMRTEGLQRGLEGFDSDLLPTLVQ